VRLFVAVWPPPSVTARLAAIDRHGPEEGVRWTREDQWHVTLRFLGEVPDHEVVLLTDALVSAASLLSPVVVEVASALSSFGRRVLHLPAAGLERWATAVGEATAAVGSSPIEDRPFHGHVTVARARPRDARAARVLAGLAGRAVPPGASSWTATELALVRSELGARGSRYTNVAVVPVG
jgi:2'-5' RNA ligase